ncbi:hypothetical protein T07_9165 [Trichinella nelsoni]|uniref:Peptidase aspartic putative domain-containing protein n=1 Tax=Trichinella nelsoni TaxID=6336 RepID=A0A0V0RFK2_9BILA|nr:hypothetical protein T07_9165 [Trichinella nelsoni]
MTEDVASALGVVGKAQPVKVEGFDGATHEHPSSQVVQLWLGRLDGSQNAERYPLSRFVGDGIRRGKSGDPVAVETVLGWIICGPVNPHPAFSAVVAESQIDDGVALEICFLLGHFLPSYIYQPSSLLIEDEEGLVFCLSELAVHG